MYDTLILNLFFKAFITLQSDVDPEMSIDSCAKRQTRIKSMSTYILLAMNYIQNKTACYTLFAWSDICVSMAEEIHQKNDPLLSMLKDVYVESKDPVPQVWILGSFDLQNN